MHKKLTFKTAFHIFSILSPRFYAKEIGHLESAVKITLESFEMRRKEDKKVIFLLTTIVQVGLLASVIFYDDEGSECCKLSLD
jgi:hypothetical protein